MATQTVEFLAVYGQTLTAKLYAVGSDTLVQTASAVTEQTNRVGVYRATFTDAPAAEYELHVATSGGIPVARWYVTLTLTTATFASYDTAVRSVTARVTADTDQWGGAPVTGMPMPTYTQPTGFLAATFPATVSSYAGGAVASVTGAVGSVTAAVTVGTNNDKTGYTLTVTPPTAAAIADAVWDEIMSTHTINGSYGSHVVRSANQNQNTVAVTGSQHIAADIHQLQPAVIDSTHFAANWLTAAGTAADYIAELQTAIGTATNQAAILDRLGYTLAVLAGTISDAQTAAETYAIVLGANTFTVDFTGLDASGNRTGQALTKV
jgi:hypothetical protein